MSEGRILIRYIIMDLEWNGAFSSELGHYFNEIIEIGAVCLDERFEKVSEFGALIAPRFTRKLSGRVKRLTRITNSDVSSGREFCEVLNHFSDWVGDDQNCIVTFGTGDILVMLENYEAYGLDERPEFIKSYLDLQQLCVRRIGGDPSQQPGLSAVAQALGIPFDEMEMHRALDDSLVSADCFRAAFDMQAYFSLVKTADEEFYKWLTFKTVVISDVANPIIQRSSLMAVCPDCGVFLKRSTSFTSRNRGIIAQFFCGKCGKHYKVRHYFKLKYEGLVQKTTVTVQSAGAASEEAEE